MSKKSTYIARIGLPGAAGFGQCLAAVPPCHRPGHAAPPACSTTPARPSASDGNNVLTTCRRGHHGQRRHRQRRRAQDGRFGRDVASPTKLGGGAAGFDFTPLDASGNAITLTTGTTPVPTSTPSCVKDNITNLIWEVKTSSGLQSSGHAYRWGSTTGGSSCGGSVSPCNTDAYIAALNAANVCGETANDWRLPTRRELLSHGALRHSKSGHRRQLFSCHAKLVVLD
jgi:hypothetical protein